jgi:hypothetical protein
MIDEQTFKNIKQLQREDHSPTYIAMWLELEDGIIEAALRAKNYAEFTEESMSVL